MFGGDRLLVQVFELPTAPDASGVECGASQRSAVHVSIRYIFLSAHAQGESGSGEMEARGSYGSVSPWVVSTF